MDYIDSNVALIGLLLRFTARDLRNSDRQFSHFTNCQRKTTQSLGYLPRTEIQKYCQNLLISNLVTLEQYPAFPLGLSFTQTGLWERERSWSRKKRGLPGCAEN